MKTSILGLALVAGLAWLPASDANAAYYLQNATGTCNGALPAFEQSLRFRPLAVANEGTTNAFVTCTQLNRFANDVNIVLAYVQNPTTDPKTISCTLVTGRDSYAKSSYPKSITLAAGEFNAIVWTASDNNGAPFLDLSNLSCNLPDGAELEIVGIETTPNPI